LLNKTATSHLVRTFHSNQRLNSWKKFFDKISDESVLNAKYTLVTNNNIVPEVSSFFPYKG